MRKSILNQNEWSKVSAELESEYDKLRSYDYTILEYLGNVRGLKVLDFGSGPGVLAAVLKSCGANVKIFDISKEMRELAAHKLGRSAVFETIQIIPDNNFDLVLCNLVVCIVSESEVAEILNIAAQKINRNGSILIGFCNPLIYSVRESRLDYRFPLGESYECNHNYKKIKKEGNYEIIEKHRPIEWYKSEFNKAGLQITNTLFTPEYELNGFEIKDFIIFELKINA